jgi:DNA-binding XRE family transcriptional regulator
MSGQPEFSTYTRDEFVAELVHPDDRAAVEEARQRRVLQVRAEYLTEMRKKAGLTQAEVAEAIGVSQQRVSAIESGSVAKARHVSVQVRGVDYIAAGATPRWPGWSSPRARSSASPARWPAPGSGSGPRPGSPGGCPPGCWPLRPPP